MSILSAFTARGRVCSHSREHWPLPAATSGTSTPLATHACGPSSSRSRPLPEEFPSAAAPASPRSSAWWTQRSICSSSESGRSCPTTRRSSAASPGSREFSRSWGDRHQRGVERALLKPWRSGEQPRRLDGPRIRAAGRPEPDRSHPGRRQAPRSTTDRRQQSAAAIGHRGHWHCGGSRTAERPDLPPREQRERN